MPLDLVERVHTATSGTGRKKRQEWREGTLLVWSIIKSGYYEGTNNWRYIHSDNFKRVNSKFPTYKEQIDWLIDEGFIERGDSYQSGVRPKTFKLKQWRKTVPYLLEHESKNLRQSLAKQDKDKIEDDLCLHTSEQLDLFTPQPKLLKLILRKVLLFYLWGGDVRGEGTLKDQVIDGLNEKVDVLDWVTAYERDSQDELDEKVAENARKIERLNKSRSEDQREIGVLDKMSLTSFGLPLLKMVYQCGYSVRGPLSNRIFSPLTGLMKEFRQGFWFDKSPWTILDCQCCQPTLLAHLSNDKQLIDDCFTDDYYDRLAEGLEVTRARAKQAYCEYAYGQNRSENARNKTALAVQSIMEKHYPTAHQFVWKGKENGHKPFIRKLQQHESEIFVDGVLRRMKDEGINGLTIHDGVLLKTEDTDTVRPIIEEEMERAGIHKFVVKPEQKKTYEEMWEEIALFDPTKYPRKDAVEG